MKLSYAAMAGAAIVSFSIIAAPGTAATLPKDANTTCPVMVKEEVNPDLHVQYKGKTIYMCCTKCKRKFLKNPEKYMARLKSDDKATTATKAKPKSPAK